MHKLISSAWVICFPILWCGCATSTPQLPQATTKPAVASASNLKTFNYPDGGITISYPADWKPVTGTKSQLKVAAPSGGQFTLDVPTLPFHLPGMVPIDAVRNGYVDDAKKKITDGVATNLPDPAVPDAKQHQVKIAGKKDGKSAVNEAVLLVHNDKVYILSIDTDDKGYDQMHAALDAVVKSLQWSK